METPTPSFENTLPSPSTSRNGIQSRLFNNSSSLYTSHTPQAGSSFHTPIRHTLKRLHASTFHNSPGLKHRAPRLIPLISKFEALDAESLRFSVRDAQPPHLRLTRTRMSWQNINDMKATREKLLGLFERPGWGATTLRGLQDTSRRDVNRIFNEVSHENEKGPSRTTRYEAIYQSMSPSDINSNSGQGWLPNASPGDGRENRIQERIKVFDRVAAQTPSKSSSIVPITKSRRYPAPLSKQGFETRTPAKSYGQLGARKLMPSSLKTPGSTVLREDVQLPQSPATPGTRGRPPERFYHTLITPPPSNTIAVARKVEIIHQDPTRIVSQKVSILSTSISKERDQICPRATVQKKDPSSTPCPISQALSSHNIIKRQSTDDGKSVVGYDILRICPARVVEYTAQAKEKGIHDRINLFSDGCISSKGLAVPICRMRYNSLPSKLISQKIHLTQNEITNKILKPIQVSKKQTVVNLTPLALLLNTDNVASNVTPEPTNSQQLQKLQAQEGNVQHSTVGNWSRIGERIKQFEAFASGQQAGLGGITLTLPQSKRLQTWPIPASEKAVEDGAGHTATPAATLQLEKQKPEAEKGAGEPKTEKSKKTKTDREKEERDRRKINSRQERLMRRSRSRSRSATSASELANKGRKKVLERVGQRQSGIDVEIALASDHEQRFGDGIVHEICIDDGDDERSGGAFVVDTVVAQCELAAPRPLRLAETLRMIRLCRGRFEESHRKGRSWRKGSGRDSERGWSAVV